MRAHRSPERICLAIGIMLFMLLFTSALLAQGNSNPNKQAKQGKNPDASSPKDSTPTQASDPVHDVMTTSFTSQDACSLFKPEIQVGERSRVQRLRDEISAIEGGHTFDKWSSSLLASAIPQQCPDCRVDVDTATKKKSDTIYIFHVVTWDTRTSTSQKDKSVTVPLSSAWQVYQLNGLDTLKSTGIGGDGEPRIYNKKNMLIVGIDKLKNEQEAATIVEAYTSTATQGTPQNQTDMAALISALVGVSSKGSIAPQVEGQVPFECRVIYIASGLQGGTARLPFTTKVSVSSADHYGTTTAKSKTASTAASREATGNITRQDAACSPNSCVELSLSSTPGVIADISGAFSGTLEFEVAPNATSFKSVKAYSSSTGTVAASTTSTGEWVVPTPAMARIRVRASVLTAGAANVSLKSLSIPATTQQGKEITTHGTTCTPETSCIELPLSSVPMVMANVSGSYSGTLEFEVSRDGASFSGETAFSALSGLANTSISTGGQWVIPTAGLAQVRLRASALTGGTPTVSLQALSQVAPTTSPADSTPSDQGAKDQTKPASEPALGVMSCTGESNSMPCTTTRSFTSVDREWWDVSIGIATPGVRESKYSIVNGALKNSVTTHTDLYGMLDIYPFAFALEKNDWAPHFNLGVPVTSQSLYRPYFGAAWSIGGLLTRFFRPNKQISLPVDMNAFGGMVWMKTQIVSGTPTTPSELTADLHYTRVWKPVFGIEVPVSAVASKIKGAAGKNSNSSSKSGASSGGS